MYYKRKRDNKEIKFKSVTIVAKMLTKFLLSFRDEESKLAY